MKILDSEYVKIKDKYISNWIKIRKNLHTFPELSFLEHKTTEFIISELKNKNIIEIIQPTKTGLIAIFNPLSKGKTVALRADIDALPILEQNDVSYKSQHQGIMHACGHDVHTTCLLASIDFLQKFDNKDDRRIVLIFQAGEEQLPGGASILMQTGILEELQIEAIFGLHVHPGMHCGVVGSRVGPFMASADEIYLNIIGKGGHAAQPESLIDTVAISCEIISQLQQVVSRKLDPKTPSVLSFGKINSIGGATNIIPDRVEIAGTLRTFDENQRALAKKWIKNIAQHTALAFGANCEVDIRDGYPALIIDEEVGKKSIDLMKSLHGSENFVYLDARMGAEDFAYYTHSIPAFFLRLGIDDPTGNRPSYGLHTSRFDVEEQCIFYGAASMAYWALNI